MTGRRLKPWRRPKSEQVTAGLVEYLRDRDGLCVVPIVDPDFAASSPCFGRQTVEHVRHRAAMGAPRAPSNRMHTVSACLGHIEWTKTARAKKLENERLDAVEPGRSDCHDGHGCPESQAWT